MSFYLISKFPIVFLITKLVNIMNLNKKNRNSKFIQRIKLQRITSTILNKWMNNV